MKVLKKNPFATKILRSTFFLTGWLLVLTPSLAQTGFSPASTSKKLKPLEISFTTLGGLSYSLDGSLLRDYKDFERIIDPLRDFEASRLLKRSEDSHAEANLFRLAGVAGFLTGLVGVLATSSGQQTPFWLTGAGGAVLVNIGGLFENEAQTTKFNCAQRYNRFARGEEQVLPQGPQDEKSLLNFDKGTVPSK
jgi:hypothetical protein